MMRFDLWLSLHLAREDEAAHLTYVVVFAYGLLPIVRLHVAFVSRTPPCTPCWIDNLMAYSFVMCCVIACWEE